MIRRPPRSTRTDTLLPYPTLFRSGSPELTRALLSSRLRHDRSTPKKPHRRGAMAKPPDWRSENYAKAYETYDRTDFAQEFLRRNHEYRDPYAEAVAAAPIALSRLTRHWVLVFRVGPASSTPPAPR